MLGLQPGNYPNRTQMVRPARRDLRVQGYRHEEPSSGNEWDDNFRDLEAESFDAIAPFALHDSKSRQSPGPCSRSEKGSLEAIAVGLLEGPAQEARKPVLTTPAMPCTERKRANSKERSAIANNKQSIEDLVEDSTANIESEPSDGGEPAGDEFGHREVLISDKSNPSDNRIVKAGRNATRPKSRKYVCKVCSRSFTSYCNTKIHIQKKHKKSIYKPHMMRYSSDRCEAPGLFPSIEELHKQNKKLNIKFYCFICKKKFGNKMHGLIHFHKKHGFDKNIYESIYWSDVCSANEEINGCKCACQSYRAPHLYVKHVYRWHPAEYGNMKEVKLGI